MDGVRRVPVRRDGTATDDEVAVEEPLEIRVGGMPLAVVMRTPGHDMELAAGFLLTEGILGGPDELGALAHCRDAEQRPLANVVNAVLASGVVREIKPRAFAATAACGICGKDSIEAVRLRVTPLTDPLRVSAAALSAMAASLSASQDAFRRTGGVHGAGLFTPDGKLVAVREDVGRHNAVDKIVGRAVIAEAMPLAGHVLVVSGRIGFEIAQKAAVARVPVLAGVGAASSLAIEMATEVGMTLVGWVRDGRATVYSGAERIG